MNLRQLQYLYDTAQTENMTKTAEKHMVPPSAVSASIKKLEKELGVSLFDRGANQITLNSKGKYFATQLGAVFDILDYAVKQITTQPAETPQIKLLIRTRSRWITDLIVEYNLQNEGLSFSISNDNTTTDFANYDFIIDDLRDIYADWNHFLLSTEKICIKAAQGSPLVGKQLFFSQLKNEPFILPSVGNGMRNLYDNTCKHHNIEPNITIECDDRLSRHRYVEAGMGLTLGSVRSLTEDDQQSLVPLEIVDFDEVQTVCVFYKRNESLSYHLKDFFDFLYEKRIG